MAGSIPIVFVGCGTPELALDERRGAELGAWAATLPRPRAILCVSHGWATSLPTRGTTSRPRLLHDGAAHLAPSVRYEAPGAPDLAADLHAIARVERDPLRGWDWGVWAPLVHMFPRADVPVLQLSLIEGATPRRLFGLGRRLGTLAAQGVLIVASGAITREAGRVDPSTRDAPAPSWAREFDGWCANLLADAEIEELLAFRTAGPGARMAHPGATRYLDPLFVAAGAASLYEHAVGFPVRGFEHGGISTRCVQFGR